MEHDEAGGVDEDNVSVRSSGHDGRTAAHGQRSPSATRLLPAAPPVGLRCPLALPPVDRAAASAAHIFLHLA
jgi:hypothetical protein